MPIIGGSPRHLVVYLPAEFQLPLLRHHVVAQVEIESKDRKRFIILQRQARVAPRAFNACFIGSTLGV